MSKLPYSTHFLLIFFNYFSNVKYFIEIRFEKEERMNVFFDMS